MKKKDDLNFFPINWYFIGAVNVPALNRICFWPLGTKLIILKYVYHKCSSVAQLHKLQGICCSQASALLIVFWSNAASNSNFNYGDFLLLICLWGVEALPLKTLYLSPQCRKGLNALIPRRTIWNRICLLPSEVMKYDEALYHQGWIRSKQRWKADRLGRCLRFPASLSFVVATRLLGKPWFNSPNQRWGVSSVST